MNFNNVTNASVKGRHYSIHFWYMNKDDAINIMKNSDLNQKKWIIIIFFLDIKDE